MRAINPNDSESKNEIEIRQRKLGETIDAAIESLASKDINRAIVLLNEAKHLCYYVGDGLRVKIQNEHSDLEMHHTLTRTIDALKATS